MCVKTYYIYIMTNNTKTLYIGMTNNLQRRVYEHKNHLVKGFTSKYRISKLIYYETTKDVNSAIIREKQLKNWHRQWKINLIEENNPEWNDLAKEWNIDPESSSPVRLWRRMTSLLSFRAPTRNPAFRKEDPEINSG